MWLWEYELRQVGFRSRSGGYWQCERAFGLPAHAYVSIFVGNWDVRLGRGNPPSRRRLHVCTFHVTFLLDVDNIHFYYHEHSVNAWEPGGYTSSTEILRHGVDPRQLRQRADEIAARVAAAFGGELLPRG